MRSIKLFERIELQELESVSGTIVFLLTGAVAGWLAGLVMRGHGFGAIGNIVLGMLGALIGAVVLNVTGISLGAGLLGSFVTGLVGAAVLLFVAGLLK